MARHWTALVTCLVFSICLLTGAASAQAQKATSASAVPSPQKVLGFVPGDDRTIADWNQITDYFGRLDKASDRVLVQTIGRSTKGRPLIVAFISAPENLSDLDRLKEIQLRLSDPRLVRSATERDRLINEGRVVVAISCSIHSTEIVASQMSMQLAYEMATAQDPETLEILKNTVLILIPSPNPDGIDIVSNWYRKTIGTRYEGISPPELYHHYAGHDNNRDWFMLNLRETEAVSGLFWREWFPQIVFDVHQQSPNGARFFIPPFYDPPNPHISPLLLRQVGLVGHKIAADLQAAGLKGVITNASYDTWWHGGFRTAPYYHNSIGILSEAASARLMSPTTITREQLARATSRGMRNALETTTNFPDPWPGGEWRPRDIMRMEMIAARSVLLLATKFRTNYLDNFFELNRQSVSPNATHDPIAYLIPAGQGRDEAVAKLINTLVNQGIEVHRLDRELHMIFGPESLERTNAPEEKVGNYQKVMQHASEMHEVPAGSYLVLLSQPQRSNVLALLGPQLYPNRLTPQGEAERPYDVAGWTLSMQMGVDVPAVMAIQEPAAERRLRLIQDGGEVRKDLGLSLKKGEESPVARPVARPARIGIYKSWTVNMDEGWTRYVFDTFNLTYESLHDAAIRAGQLASKFDVIILPSQRSRDIINGHAAGSYPPEFTRGITTSGVANLKSFVESGGTVVCFDASCELTIKEFNLPIRNVLEGVRSADFFGPGSIVALEVDTTHGLARGMPARVDAYFINSSAFEATDPRVSAVARYAKENLLRSGWLLGESRLRGQIAIAEAKLGKGRVILFGFRPQHRGQTWGTFPFIWNSIVASEN
ncbi:MAG TPA: M14 family metallopeptidase [Pyrinomonadaceae bacterium]|nr:M14 family metallopeptidase [Pyrinomonadaceae bacterium]